MTEQRLPPTCGIIGCYIAGPHHHATSAGTVTVVGGLVRVEPKVKVEETDPVTSDRQDDFAPPACRCRAGDGGPKHWTGCPVFQYRRGQSIGRRQGDRAATERIVAMIENAYQRHQDGSYARFLLNTLRMAITNTKKEVE